MPLDAPALLGHLTMQSLDLAFALLLNLWPVAAGAAVFFGFAFLLNTVDGDL